ncbi:hypothetical protein [Streptomyces subrutilus]|uniref:hypothetical protein n=1 Tax=Streptomyces subrutilus TaxID=36818 RepID=UPI00114D2DED|nr:hypothetical protein [Streptomyces subrutilus]
MATDKGPARGDASWLSRDTWRSMASGTGLARLSHCLGLDPTWQGFALRLPRFDGTLTWRSIRREREERAHDAAPCAACGM